MPVDMTSRLENHPLDAAAEAAIADQVSSAKARMLFRALPTSTSGSILGAILLTMVLWPSANHEILVVWCAAMVVNQAWRLELFRRTRHLDFSAGRHARWVRIWSVGGGVSGLIWGAAMFLFYPDLAGTQQVVLLATLFAIVSVSLPVTVSHLPSFYSFVLPVLLSMIAANVMMKESHFWLVAFVSTVMLAAIITVGRQFNRLLDAALTNRFRNAALADQLARQNAELDAARHQAEQASRAKTQFFAAASHDLRQPLHAMGLFAAALANKVRDPEVSNLVNSITASVEALEGLFSELLDISKIDSGKIKPQIVDFPLQQVFDRLRMDCEPEAYAQGLTLVLRPCRRYVHSDPMLLERILRNFISNAIRYTREGRILVGARREGESLRIEVWDTGFGIPDQEQERIFEEFVQLANPERDRRKGLGLSIVKRLAALMGHRISMASREGRGSKFSITVPVVLNPAPRRAAPSPPLATMDLSGIFILVIDDEIAILDGMAALLSGWGAEVLACPSGSEALQQVEDFGRTPDLIIADYQLREGEVGTQAVAKLRARCGVHIPAIMVTGSATPERLEEAKDLGDHLLIKPVMPAKLRSLVQFKLRATES